MSGPVMRQGTEIAVNEAVSTYLAWKLGEVVECESVSLGVGLRWT